MARLPIFLFSLGVGPLAPGPIAMAQQDTAMLARGTLHGWEEQVRLAVFDRGGSFNGRLSNRGILQRFNERMDSEYDLDVISSAFALPEQYAWYQRSNGARFWAGSIDDAPDPARRLQGVGTAGRHLGGGCDLQLPRNPHRQPSPPLAGVSTYPIRQWRPGIHTWVAQGLQT